MTATSPTVRRRPLGALVTAEYRQFRRNKTLMFMATLFPIGLPLLTYFIGRDGGDVSPLLLTTTLETFALMALLFVQYYSVLSLVTTRRGEGVLRRLQTGEARDWQILTAPAVPGAIATLGCSVIVAAVVYATGASAPVNPVLMVAAMVLGVIIFALLALATSAMTKNAEAAQITSMPVMVLAMVGMGVIRTILPDNLARLADRTPFAAVSDLVSLGATGKVATAPDSAGAFSFAETFTEGLPALATLGAWAIVALLLAKQYFRWDDR